MRKTIEIKTLIDYANHQLSRTDSEATIDYKRSVCDMIEGILHMSNNYSGFMFINSSDIEHGSMGYFSRKYLINRKLL